MATPHHHQTDSSSNNKNNMRANGERVECSTGAPHTQHWIWGLANKSKTLKYVLKTSGLRSTWNILKRGRRKKYFILARTINLEWRSLIHRGDLLSFIHNLYKRLCSKSFRVVGWFAASCWYISVSSFGFLVHLLSFSCLFLVLFFHFSSAFSFNSLPLPLAPSNQLECFFPPHFSVLPVFHSLSCVSLRHFWPECLDRCGSPKTAARCCFIGWLVIKSNTKTFYFFYLMVFILFLLSLVLSSHSHSLLIFFMVSTWHKYFFPYRSLRFASLLWTMASVTRATLSVFQIFHTFACTEKKICVWLAVAGDSTRNSILFNFDQWLLLNFTLFMAVIAGLTSTIVTMGFYWYEHWIRWEAWT